MIKIEWFRTRQNARSGDSERRTKIVWTHYKWNHENLNHWKEQNEDKTWRIIKKNDIMHLQRKSKLIPVASDSFLTPRKRKLRIILMLLRQNSWSLEKQKTRMALSWARFLRGTLTSPVFTDGWTGKYRSATALKFISQRRINVCANYCVSLPVIIVFRYWVLFWLKTTVAINKKWAFKNLSPKLRRAMLKTSKSEWPEDMNKRFVQSLPRKNCRQRSFEK